MVEIIFSLMAFLYGLFRYTNAYNSYDEKYSKPTGLFSSKPNSGFLTHTHTVMFGFPPIFGAATIFLIYEHLGGELNFISLFLLLLSVILGPILMVKKYNERKIRTTPQKYSAPKEEAVIFTRNTSPEKLKTYRQYNVIMLLIIICIFIGVLLLK